MIKLLGKVPRDITVAFSGGLDSTVLLDFLRRNHNVTAAFFDHGTLNSARARLFVEAYCDRHDVPLKIGEILESWPSSTSVQTGVSPEEHWRNCRYHWFYDLGPVVAAHNLNDAVETWIWSSLHGTPSIMPYRHANVFRPLLTTSRAEIEFWAARNNLSWCEDLSNTDTRYTRNYIRHELMPGVLRVNPGIHTMLRKKIAIRWQKMDQFDVDSVNSVE
jgi:tRNA(Ile)-lysidine synthase